MNYSYARWSFNIDRIITRLRTFDWIEIIVESQWAHLVQSCSWYECLPLAKIISSHGASECLIRTYAVDFTLSVTRWFYNERWRHDMVNLSASLSLCALNSTGTATFPSDRASNTEFGILAVEKKSRIVGDLTPHDTHLSSLWWVRSAVVRSQTCY